VTHSLRNSLQRTSASGRRHDDESGFSLTEEEQVLLADAIAQVERGEWIDGWQLLDELKA